MASTAFNSRVLEAMVTSRPEPTTSSPVNGQDVPTSYLEQYTATLEDFARRTGDLMAAAAVSGGAASPSGGELTTEDEEGSCDDNSSGGRKSSIPSPLDPAKKRRKQSKPSKIEGSEGVVGEGDEAEREDDERGPIPPREEAHLQGDAATAEEERRDSEKSTTGEEEPGRPNMRCPHCQASVSSHEDLRQHIIEEHIGRIVTEEEILLRHAQQAKQKLLEQHHNLQQYHQKMLAEAMRQQQEHQSRREGRDQLLQQQHQQQHQQQLQDQQHGNGSEKNHHQGQPHLERQQHHHHPQSQQLHHLHQINSYADREEGETGPLNLSSPRWDNRSSQDPQRSPVTPLPASIPMPPSFADGRFNLPGLLPFGPPPFLIPFMQQQNDRENGLSAGQSVSFNPGQSRIFNLEAFCDLCNKEFCNKYFLKTHKANKHGIFTPEPSCSPMPPTPPTPLGPTTPLGLNPPLLAPLVHSPMTPTSMGGSPYVAAFMSASLSNLGNLAALRPPPPTPVHNHPKSSSNSSKSEPSMNKTGVINLDAYCELCQKEFCNKYFLKRHKLKIHGVNIEVTIKSPKSNPALDRPEGWCDACRRDIGSRASLNAHKLHVHGPHIVNNISVGDTPNRPPIDFRALSAVPMKMNNGDRDTKDNFSPWDMMRERELLENASNWNARSSSTERNVSARNELPSSDRNGREENHLLENMEFDSKSNSSLSLHNAVISESLGKKDHRAMIDGPTLSSHFNDVRKIKLPQTNGIKGGSPDQVRVKEEEKLVGGGNDDDHKKERTEAEPDPQMPVLKPQIESQGELLSVPPEIGEPEERPPPLLKEQVTPHNRMEEDEAPEVGQNSTDPPRTPGGVSNSTDDSSREAGIIARVGQPAIVQVPPGTKFTTEQLRQLGVINPDAFCELCCKEFCNKYFLRTHRIKKHNIYTPEYSERSKQHFKESPPINLARILESQSLEYRPPNMPEVDSDMECDICRRPFPSPYLLHMHKYYFHGPNQDNVLSENLPLPEHILPQEQLRQLALHAHQQKIQDHHQQLLRQHKHQQQLQQQEQLRQNQQQQQQEHQQRQHQFQQQQQQHQQQRQHQAQQQKLHEENEYQMVKHEDEIHTEKHKSLERLQNEMYEKNVKPEQNEHEGKEEQEARLMKSPDASPGQPDNSNGSTGGEADTSQELRKLQSMILELNRQGEETIQCKVCHKEIGNKYFLRAHMMTEHGILLQDEHSNSEAAQTPKTPFESNGRLISPLSSLTSDSQAYCDLCKKDFFSRYILQQHMLSAHGIFTQHQGPTSFLDRIRAEVEGREDRKPQSVSRSFCEICNKELCNKYFMKTHMLKMHGINVENGTSGGVTCDICNKELCSKYFLKVHRQNTHGLVEDIPRENKDVKDGMPRERKEGDEPPEDEASIEICPLCQRKFKNIKWLRTHLTQDHGEDGKAKWREMEPLFPPLDILTRPTPTCSICGQMQPDVVSLQLHLIKHHSSPKQDEGNSVDPPLEKAMQCSSCSFVCRSPALLAAHERSHTPVMPMSSPRPLSNSPIPCNMCPQILPNMETLQHHLIGHQLQGLFEPLLSKSQPHSVFGGGRTDSSQEGGQRDQLDRHRRESPLHGVSKKPQKRWRCRRCNLSFKKRSSCLVHVFRRHSGRPPTSGSSISTTQKIWGRKVYKCRQCGSSERRLSDLLNHIRSHCRRRGAMYYSGAPPVVAHARPADQGTLPQNFVMQSFLMAEEGGGQHEEGRDGEFVPSVVQLPVSRLQHRTLTVSFTLTPA